MPVVLFFLAWYDRHVVTIGNILCLTILAIFGWGYFHYGWSWHHG